MKSRISEQDSSPIRIGFISQIDCAPIAVAQEIGIFARYNLDVRLSRELGLASIRDKISFGQLDVAQSTPGMSIGLGLGLNMMRNDVAVPLVFNLHGIAITISTEIGRGRIGRGEKINEFLDYGWKKERPMLLAVPHRFSSEHCLLNIWLSRYGVVNNRKLEIIYLPSFLMPRLLKSGHIDGFCSPEPWNSESILSGDGWCPATSVDLAAHHPGNVLMVSSDFGTRRKKEMIALVAALIESCLLCQDTDFREEMISILAQKEYVGTNLRSLGNSLGAIFNSGISDINSETFHIFHGGDVNRPNMTKASWVLSALRKYDTISNETCGSLSTVFREDICIAAEALMKSQNRLPDIPPTPQAETSHFEQASSYKEAVFN